LTFFSFSLSSDESYRGSDFPPSVHPPYDFRDVDYDYPPPLPPLSSSRYNDDLDRLDHLPRDRGDPRDRDLGRRSSRERGSERGGGGSDYYSYPPSGPPPPSGGYDDLGYDGGDRYSDYRSSSGPLPKGSGGGGGGGPIPMSRGYSTGSMDLYDNYDNYPPPPLSSRGSDRGGGGGYNDYDYPPPPMGGERDYPPPLAPPSSSYSSSSSYARDHPYDGPNSGNIPPSSLGRYDRSGMERGGGGGGLSRTMSRGERSDVPLERRESLSKEATAPVREKSPLVTKPPLMMNKGPPPNKSTTGGPLSSSLSVRGPVTDNKSTGAAPPVINPPINSPSRPISMKRSISTDEYVPPGKKPPSVPPSTAAAVPKAGVPPPPVPPGVAKPASVPPPVPPSVHHPHHHTVKASVAHPVAASPVSSVNSSSTAGQPLHAPLAPAAGHKDERPKPLLKVATDEIAKPKDMMIPMGKQLSSSSTASTSTTGVDRPKFFDRKDSLFLATPTASTAAVASVVKPVSAPLGLLPTPKPVSAVPGATATAANVLGAVPAHPRQQQQPEVTRVYALPTAQLDSSKSSTSEGLGGGVFKSSFFTPAPVSDTSSEAGTTTAGGVGIVGGPPAGGYEGFIIGRSLSMMSSDEHPGDRPAPQRRPRAAMGKGLIIQPPPKVEEPPPPPPPAEPEPSVVVEESKKEEKNTEEKKELQIKEEITANEPILVEPAQDESTTHIKMEEEQQQQPEETTRPTKGKKSAKRSRAQLEAAATTTTTTAPNAPIAPSSPIATVKEEPTDVFSPGTVDETVAAGEPQQKKKRGRPFAQSKKSLMTLSSDDEMSPSAAPVVVPPTTVVAPATTTTVAAPVVVPTTTAPAESNNPAVVLPEGLQSPSRISVKEDVLSQVGSPSAPSVDGSVEQQRRATAATNAAGGKGSSTPAAAAAAAIAAVKAARGKGGKGPAATAAATTTSASTSGRLSNRQQTPSETSSADNVPMIMKKEETKVREIPQLIVPAKKLSQKERKQLQMERLQLGNIFTKETDLHRAYNTMAYMLELQKTQIDLNNAKAVQQLTLINNSFQEIKTVQAASKLLVPKSSEICYAVDLIDSNIEAMYVLLGNQRAKQYMTESKSFIFF
jgi:hypothetical protein